MKVSQGNQRHKICASRKNFQDVNTKYAKTIIRSKEGFRDYNDKNSIFLIGSTGSGYFLLRSNIGNSSRKKVRCDDRRCQYRHDQSNAQAVFDLITTARLWPQWHAATKGVGGVVERLYGLGDLIHERGQIGDKEFQTTWKVVEHVRPSKIVLQSQTAPTRITYTFTAGKETTASRAGSSIGPIVLLP
jgi:hypothetical protein